MLESKSSKILIMILSIFIIIIDVAISYYLMRRTENPINYNITLLTAEGDTILKIEKPKGDVEIWIEENGEPDVWIKNK